MALLLGGVMLGVWTWWPLSAGAFFGTVLLPGAILIYLALILVVGFGRLPIATRGPHVVALGAFAGLADLDGPVDRMEPGAGTRPRLCTARGALRGGVRPRARPGDIAAQSGSDLGRAADRRWCRNGGCRTGDGLDRRQGRAGRRHGRHPPIPLSVPERQRLVLLPDRRFGASVDVADGAAASQPGPDWQVLPRSASRWSRSANREDPSSALPPGCWWCSLRHPIAAARWSRL